MTESISFRTLLLIALCIASTRADPVEDEFEPSEGYQECDQKVRMKSASRQSVKATQRCLNLMLDELTLAVARGANPAIYQKELDEIGDLVRVSKQKWDQCINHYHKDSLIVRDIDRLLELNVVKNVNIKRYLHDCRKAQIKFCEFAFIKDGQAKEILLHPAYKEAQKTAARKKDLSESETQRLVAIILHELDASKERFDSLSGSLAALYREYQLLNDVCIAGKLSCDKVFGDIANLRWQSPNMKAYLDKCEAVQKNACA